ncbi:phytanoyl-CoA dioxygenase family protein [Chitinophaga caseinilytica]|uniref:Phytanoyl-CoA dioxygenase family protein n=1 Tax=Chitinophaga caseinilytica TaxID=2267521 RepID=A0ABZ2Z3I2_9BACT
MISGFPSTLQFSENGFAITQPLFSDDQIAAIVQAIDTTDHSHPAFRKSADLFAVRRFLHEVPAVQPLVLTDALLQLVETFAGSGYRPVKSIYFDKPPESNWFVSYHQDLTISVDKKSDAEGYGPWTVKPGQFAVQPPLPILENNLTLRIHLDDTDEHNGALRVVPGSHRKGVYRPETIDWQRETDVSCAVPRGGVMLMRPLLLHASGRTTNNRRRRVIHIEFSNSVLPEGMQWSELLSGTFA